MSFSIATLSALASVPEDDRLAATILLTLMVGLIQLAITILRIGDFLKIHLSCCNRRLYWRRIVLADLGSMEECHGLESHG